jgi:hypothetical protein
VSNALRDRVPETLIAEERTERHPVMLVSFDISFDEAASWNVRYGVTAYGHCAAPHAHNTTKTKATAT